MQQNILKVDVTYTIIQESRLSVTHIISPLPFVRPFARSISKRGYIILATVTTLVRSTRITFSLFIKLLHLSDSASRNPIMRIEFIYTAVSAGLAAGMALQPLARVNGQLVARDSCSNGVKISCSSGSASTSCSGNQCMACCGNCCQAYTGKSYIR